MYITGNNKHRQNKQNTTLTTDLGPQVTKAAISTRLNCSLPHFLQDKTPQLAERKLKLHTNSLKEPHAHTRKHPHRVFPPENKW